MKIRMLTAIAASALCITAFSDAEAGGRKGDGGGHGGGHECSNSNCGGGGGHGGGGHGGGHGGGYHDGGHNGGHHGGHHGDRDRHDKRDRHAKDDRGCDSHWDVNVGHGISPYHRRPSCSPVGAGITIVGIPGIGFEEPRYGYGYGYRYDPYGRRLPY